MSDTDVICLDFFPLAGSDPWKLGRYIETESVQGLDSVYLEALEHLNIKTIWTLNPQKPVWYTPDYFYMSICQIAPICTFVIMVIGL